MKRPKFFEDLDRSLSGEPEPEPEPVPTPRGTPQHDAAIQAQIWLNQWSAVQVASALQRSRMQRMAEDYINQTATGALIAAEQRRQSRDYWRELLGGVFEG